MKRILIVSILAFTLMTTDINAQNPSYPWGASFKTLFMDYQSQNGGDISNFGAYHHGFELGLLKSINENINVYVPFKYGVVSDANRDLNCFHKKVYGLDGQLQYVFYKPDSKLNPYAMLGVGAQAEQEGEFNLQIPFGVGAYFQIAENAYFNWQSSYRYSLGENRNNLHHGLGFTYLFGKKDTTQLKPLIDNETLLDSDGDGLEDEIDLCPQIAGPRELKGCPDQDSDGIPDYRDDCPAVAGIAAFKGCPDSDGDGISDNDDECPNLAGVASNKGCPDDGSGVNKGGMDDTTSNTDKDTDMDGIPDNLDKCPNIKGTVDNNGCPAANDSDGDGVPDSEDRCPNLRGSASAKGCPDRDSDGVSDFDDKCPDRAGLRALNGCPDSDGDGIDDSRDRCPNQAGTVANNGCPGTSGASTIDARDLSTLETAMRAVQFNTGKASLKIESNSVLNQIGDIMVKYPNYNLIIEGHTDNVGSAVNNQLLSERRAQACYEYLIRRGVSPSRMSHTGYGESNPISDNNSLTGRSLNRRVEFKLKPR